MQTSLNKKNVNVCTTKKSDVSSRSSFHLFTGRFRFRAAVKRVIDGLFWIKPEVPHAPSIKLDYSRIRHVTRCINKGVDLCLLPKEIQFLLTPVRKRTDNQIEYLTKILGTLNIYRKFPTSFKFALPGLATFFGLNAGRVIVREGSKPEGFYFILAGEARVTHVEWDPVQEKWRPYIICIFTAGHSFGVEGSLLELPYNVTITSVTNCQLLYWRKEDFGPMLQNELRKSWGEIEDALAKFDYFSDWNSSMMNNCCMISKILQFKPGETIYGDGYEYDNFTYFVIKGTCKMIHDLHVRMKLINGIKKYTLIKNKQDKLSVKTMSHSCKMYMNQERFKDAAALAMQNEVMNFERTFNLKHAYKCNDKTKNETEVHFIELCILKELSCFGVGENLDNRRFVAISDVTCLLIPLSFLARLDRKNTFNRIKAFLDTFVPTELGVFEEFKKEEKWKMYKQSLMNDIFSRKKIINKTKLQDVPLSLRVYNW